MKFKVGDIVKINGNKSNCKILKWYSNDIYTIVNIKEGVAELNKNLNNMTTNKINIDYLKLLKEERKNKLLKINRLYVV